jgi:hypothetical protein
MRGALFACAATALLLSCTHVAPPADARAASLFTLDALAYAASSVATARDRETLRPFGLLHEPNARLDLDFPIRRQLREAVQAWPRADRQAALDYFRRNAGHSTIFHAFALESFRPPPAFLPISQGPSMLGYNAAIFGRRDELARLLRYAYVRLGAGALFARLHEAWKHHQLPEARVLALKRKLLAYIQWDPTRKLPRFELLVNPLMQVLTGVNVEVSSSDRLLIAGPAHTDADFDVLVVHELAHDPVYRLITGDPRLSTALEEASCAFARVSRNDGYSSWQSYFFENLVRNLSYRVAGIPDRDTGFLVEKLLGVELRAFERASMTFTDVVQSALVRVRREYCP